MSDDTFATNFRSLAASIKSLSRSLELPVGVDLFSIDFIAQGTLVRGVEHKSVKTRQHQKAIIEAFVWSILVDQVFRNPCKYIVCSKYSAAGCIAHVGSTQGIKSLGQSSVVSYMLG